MQTYLGTWQTSPSDGFWTDQDRTESTDVLSCAVRMGITCFDTAQSYGKGQSEQLLAKVLRRFPQHSFTIDTKIMPSTKEVSDLVKISSTRLGGLPIDCLYVHWPRTGFDLSRFVAQMCKLKDIGTIRKVGVCNMPLEQLQELLDKGLSIDRYQRPLSLLWSRDWVECQSFCNLKGIETAVYSPMGMGLLSGKYRSSDSLKDARSKLFCFDSRCMEHYITLLDLLETIAGRYGLSSSAVALSWTVSQKPDLLLLGARNTSQLSQNLETLNVRLPNEVLEQLTMAGNALAEASRAVCENIFSYNW